MDGGKVTLGQTAGLYAGAAVLRLALFTLFPGLPELLTGARRDLDARDELQAPYVFLSSRPSWCALAMLTRRLAVQEGLFLYNHNVSPYDGGVYHQAPLFLPLFSLLPSFASLPILPTSSTSPRGPPERRCAAQDCRLGGSCARRPSSGRRVARSDGAASSLPQRTSHRP